MFVMAGFVSANDRLDINDWNEKIINMLETYHIATPPNIEGDIAQLNEQFFGVPAPIFNRRFL